MLTCYRPLDEFRLLNRYRPIVVRMMAADFNEMNTTKLLSKKHNVKNFISCKDSLPVPTFKDLWIFNMAYTEIDEN